MRSITILLLLIGCSIGAGAQQRKALVIGINTYSPPPNSKTDSAASRFAFADLDGARNDAEVIHATLISYFGFREKDIRLLLDRDATREGILQGIEELLNSCDSGDIAVFYYAGHGSQVFNSASAEADKKDETIVPADGWKQDGMDITDKHLAKLFNRFADKQVTLTAIFDCCHSGSLSRGLSVARPKYRSVKASSFDTRDASAPLAPEQRNGSRFMIISASQDNEFAVEQRDDQERPHGAFTLSLMQAIQQLGNNVSAQNLFNSTRAILKLNGKKQEPVLAAGPERKEKNLLGLPSALLTDKLLVPVSPAAAGRFEIHAGGAQFIRKDNEFAAQLQTENGQKDSVIIRVDSVLSLTKSWGTVIRGNAQLIKGGELFELNNWVSSSAPLLKLYLPPGLSSASLNKALTQYKAFKKIKGTSWEMDLENHDPDFVLSYDRDQFMVSDAAQPLDATPVRADGWKPGKYFFQLAPSLELAQSLKNKLAKTTGILLVDKPEDAHYILYGTVNDGLASYGFLRVEASSRDSLGSLPVQTRAIRYTGTPTVHMVVDSLCDQVMKLAKVRGWLSLAAPRGGAPFPFQLQLVNAGTKKRMDSIGVKIGDTVELHLVASPQARYTSIAQKFIYSFAIDKQGTMTLLFPDEYTGNSDNKFPRYHSGKLEEDLLLTSFEIAEPAGSDTYFLVVCDEPIQNYEKIFQQTGTRSVNTQSSNHPIVQLLNLGNEGQLRGLKKSSISWALLRMTVKSTH